MNERDKLTEELSNINEDLERGILSLPPERWQLMHAYFESIEEKLAALDPAEIPFIFD